MKTFIITDSYHNDKFLLNLNEDQTKLLSWLKFKDYIEEYIVIDEIDAIEEVEL